MKKNIETTRRYALVRWVALGLALSACAPAAREPGAPVPEPEPEEEVEDPTRDAVVRVGVILPREAPGTLRQYGEQVRAGVDIAFNDAPDRIEVVYVDDGGDVQMAARRTRELEEQGVIAIVGPLLGEAVDAAAAARSDASLALISPTASERPRGENAYTLNAGDARGGEVLAAHALSRGMDRIAVMYPAGEEFRDQVESFRRAVDEGGGRIVADIAWQAGTTTFAGPVDRLRASGASAVFIAATDRDIRQLAPQLAYYGVTGIQILGTQAWADEAVLAQVDPRHVEGVIAAVPFLPASGDVAWDEFVGLYEAAQRRSLDSPYPALGWDAARLVLAAIGDDTAPSPGDVARRLADTEDFRGATGVLSVTGGHITRRPFLVRVRGGRAEPIPNLQR